MEINPGSEEKLEAETKSADKPTYVARWREDEHVREIKLVAEDLFGLSQVGNGDTQQLEQDVCKRAQALGWLLDGETLHFVSSELAQSNSPGTDNILGPVGPCILLNFLYCPAAYPEQRKLNLKQRHPDWIEVDHNRWLTYIGVATLVLVILQFFLLLQQNAQFDDALRQFKTVVGNYVWQVNTPVLWPTYLPDSNEIELVNYGQTPVGISSITLITHGSTDLEGNPTLSHPLLADGPVRLNEGESIRVSALPKSVIDGTDVRYGVRLEARYVYFGNRYQLIWPAIVQFKDGSVLIAPQGEPVVEPIHTVSPTLTPVGQSN